ncbi:flagellar biosynthesis protein FliQ [Fodinibius sediminis]|uniref:Flagellar biosynthetic protein FliQ n=1 Tax=Fodinibius sediminis TaxID=1214077 RepID=A0A521CIH4_9BACT|nr:flagellar biosynthesis protein FliQ [Fodinibius sediminis]SMO59224.1 flagellar biosynthetic protein FliQ [Fodinibius sediminis]
MNTEVGLYWIQQALTAIVALAGPLLLGALIVGLIIAVFQAVTTIQEMTLTYIPKMVVVAVILFFLSGFMLEYAIDFTERIFAFIATVNQ